MEIAFIVCTACDAVNRLPASKLDGRPKCGRCKKALFAGHSAALAGARFTRQIERSSIPVLIDFWAPWCGPCKAMGPSFERAAGLLEPRFRLVKVDIDSAPDVADSFAIRGVPTMILMQNGKELGRTSGAQDTQQIVRWAERTASAKAA